MRNKAFTLIEMIIVAGIIAVLAAIALPNFLSAQNRAKVSRAKAGVKVLTNGTQAYHVDWNRYPPTCQKIPEDPYGILSDVQLCVLTSPIQYVSHASFRDPFGKIRCYSSIDLLTQGYRSDFPVPQTPNPRGSVLYYNYRYFSEWTQNPWINAMGVAMVSIGPDRKDSFGAFRPFPPEALPPLARQAGILDPRDTEYDPTNGAISSGDISGFAGELNWSH